MSDKVSRRFEMHTDFEPTGDQPTAIDTLVAGVGRGRRHQTLLGVTGSGKTFTMAKVIERTQRPTLILAPNKLLAAQLYMEFKEFFPDNAVGYFISYYDYYQPEAYVPTSDTYIAKDASINDQIDRMRHAATHDLLTRRDVIIVASVSCIYGLGSPDAYAGLKVEIKSGEDMDRDQLLRELVKIQYARNDIAPRRATFRARGDVVEIFPAYADDRIIRIEFFGDTIETIDIVDALKGEVLEQQDEAVIFPSSHYVTPKDRMDRAIETIRDELEEHLGKLRGRGRLLEAQRLEMRTRLDLELMEELGTCSGIENYSRHLDGRQSGEPAATLLDYFDDDFLLLVDESHVSIPQVGGMSRGDRARKDTLVEHGFRLPSAIDNRPLTGDEFHARIRQAIYVSATPAAFELEKADGITVEQIIRPTGLLDPPVEMRPARGQVDDLLGEVRQVIDTGHRVLVTCLTKRMAEDLTTYYRDVGLRVKYLHSDIDSMERTAIIRDLRLGKFDVLIGINLLREGLDIPEVALVAILDADKEGFLRSRGSLIQTIGRASRNVDGRCILYADRRTRSIDEALAETGRRREKQEAFNAENDITPQTIRKKIQDGMESIFERDYVTVEIDDVDEAEPLPDDPEKLLSELREAMYAAAGAQQYEDAAELRDRIAQLEERVLKGR
ncbi:MAG: excinuclease ABC subunit B [Deltaproteobacteria bacterium]|nr:excinuclease ABC subunit B [Deltaproteobacteria bacterium]